MALNVFFNGAKDASPPSRPPNRGALTAPTPCPGNATDSAGPGAPRSAFEPTAASQIRYRESPPIPALAVSRSARIRRPFAADWISYEPATVPAEVALREAALNTTANPSKGKISVTYQAAVQPARPVAGLARRRGLPCLDIQADPSRRLTHEYTSAATWSA